MGAQMNNGDRKFTATKISLTLPAIEARSGGFGLEPGVQTPGNRVI